MGMRRNCADMGAGVGAIVVAGRREEAEVGPGGGVEVAPIGEAEVAPRGEVRVGLKEGAEVGLKEGVQVNPEEGEAEVDLRGEVKGQEARKGAEDLGVKRKGNQKAEIKEDQGVGKDHHRMKYRKEKEWNRKM